VVMLAFGVSGRSDISPAPTNGSQSNAMRIKVGADFRYSNRSRSLTSCAVGIRPPLVGEQPSVG
jgi:hypothetical protein